ncbi:phage tail protein [Skermanella mucosa]|uniref:phage tail protein n=1 Tax=Skermanella mucosa TaxID=1789672 RepID=UPI00192BFEA8|nr:phage tail protein [Skermanella mucosa]UEM18977.1 phage tail protein [Skermanella mucosa]
MATPSHPLPNGLDAKISQAVAGSFNQARRTIEFGDGYVQHQKSGINGAGATYSVEWVGLSETDAATLIAFFEARGGVERIRWKPPLRSAEQLFTCATFNAKLTNGSGILWTVTADFERTFSP